MSIQNKLTQKRLKELLCYEPDTGLLIWLVKNHHNAPSVGSLAGHICKRGYRLIKIDGKNYRAGRLAWLYMEGYFPENDIDHINRIKSDDRWKNLRHVSRQCNVRNCDILNTNTSGITGVYWDKSKQRWKATIVIFYRKFYLGSFKKKLNAAKARWKAELKHGFQSCNDDSSAYLYIKERER